MKCLIVEDNQFTRIVIKSALERMGHNVVGEAESFLDAKNLINKVDADVILLDLVLPDGSGIELIGSDIKNKKIVAITAVDQELVDLELKKKGVKAILKKPFSYEELENVMKRI